MDKIKEKKPKSLLLLFLVWIVAFMLLEYVMDVSLNFISDIQNGEIITLSSFFLGTSYNWESFWRVKINTIPFGIALAIVGWLYVRYIQR